MSNPRNINQVKQSSTATKPAQLPAIPTVRAADKVMVDAVNALKQRAEVREGERGNPWEAVVTMRQLDELGLVRTGDCPGSVHDLAGMVGQTKSGEFVVVSLDELAKAIMVKMSKATGGEFA